MVEILFQAGIALPSISMALRCCVAIEIPPILFLCWSDLVFLNSQMQSNLKECANMV